MPVQRKDIAMTSGESDGRKRLERLLLEKESDLAEKNHRIEEMTVSLRVMLEQGQTHRYEVESNVLYNVEQLIMPLLKQLQSMHLNKHYNRIVQSLETNLRSLVSPFARHAMLFNQFSPKEMQVANLVKMGRSNREISEMLGVSINTVITHRYRIRCKLGLKKKRINLRAYLQEMERQ